MSSVSGLDHQRLLPASLEARLIGYCGRVGGCALLLTVALPLGERAVVVGLRPEPHACDRRRGPQLPRHARRHRFRSPSRRRSVSPPPSRFWRRCSGASSSSAPSAFRISAPRRPIYPAVRAPAGWRAVVSADAAELAASSMASAASWATSSRISAPPSSASSTRARGRWPGLAVLRHRRGGARRNGLELKDFTDLVALGRLRASGPAYAPVERLASRASASARMATSPPRTGLRRRLMLPRLRSRSSPAAKASYAQGAHVAFDGPPRGTPPGTAPVASSGWPADAGAFQRRRRSPRPMTKRLRMRRLARPGRSRATSIEDDAEHRLFEPRHRGALRARQRPACAGSVAAAAGSGSCRARAGPRAAQRPQAKGLGGMAQRWTEPVYKRPCQPC